MFISLKWHVLLVGRLVPFAVGLVQQRTITLFSERVTIDGTRPLLLCAAAGRDGRAPPDGRPAPLVTASRPAVGVRVRSPASHPATPSRRRLQNERVGRPGRARRGGGDPRRSRRTGRCDDPRLAVRRSAGQRSLDRGTGRSGPEPLLRNLEAVLGCREALELNVKPRIAIEALTSARQSNWRVLRRFSSL